MNGNPLKSRGPALFCWGLTSYWNWDMGIVDFMWVALWKICFYSGGNVIHHHFENVKDVGQLQCYPHSSRPFVFHSLWFYYSSSVLEGGSGKSFVSYLTVIHNLPRNHHDIVNHPNGKLLKEIIFYFFFLWLWWSMCGLHAAYVQQPYELFNKSYFFPPVHNTTKIPQLTWRHLCHPYCTWLYDGFVLINIKEH